MKADQDQELQDLLTWLKAQPIPEEPIKLGPGETITDLPKLLRATEGYLLSFTKPAEHPTYQIYLHRLHRIREALGDGSGSQQRKGLPLL